MAKIDIRSQESYVDFIVFGDAEEGAHSEYVSNAVMGDPAEGWKYIYITSEKGSAGTWIRKTDVSNLIKALQKAQEIWKDCV